MADFNRIVNPGITSNGPMFCKIEYAKGRLSITGVEGPKPNGNCRGWSGQIIMHEWAFKTLSRGWTTDIVNRFRDAWDKWHLNVMQAGSPAQTAWIEANPLDYKYPKSHYDVYSDALTAAGLNPDPGFVHNGKPYKYGSAWLAVNVPDDVIEFLQSLPETTVKPAWV